MSTLDARTKVLNRPLRLNAVPHEAEQVDAWARWHLHHAYDPILEEPMPDELVRLAMDHASEWMLHRHGRSGSATRS